MSFRVVFSRTFNVCFRLVDDIASLVGNLSEANLIGVSELSFGCFGEF